MIFINFKTYKEATGDAAITLAHTLCDTANETGIEVTSCPQEVDLREVVEASDHPVWTQHVDPVERGRHTGWFPPEVAKETGAEGTLLNHSEHKLSVGVLSEAISRSKDMGLKTLVFADTLEEAKMVAMLKPDYIGYEPPELVGSKDTSVAKAKTDVIKKVTNQIKNIPIIVGAGIKSKKDVEVSLKLGAVGVVVSSGVVLADNPKDKVMELAGGFKK